MPTMGNNDTNLAGIKVQLLGKSRVPKVEYSQFQNKAVNINGLTAKNV